MTASQGIRPPPMTLVVDIGGTYLKSGVADGLGEFEEGWVRERTPSPATPAAVLDVIAGFASRGTFDRISIGFPGVVSGGLVLTAPNLGTPSWRGFALVKALSERFGKPVRMINDAAMHGLGLVEGPGLDCMLTLGTGLGCALYRGRKLLLHLELGQFERSQGITFDGYVGQRAFAAVGREAWSGRVVDVAERVIALTNCDCLYLGGGNAANITLPLPGRVRVVPSKHGLGGGVRLWDATLDEHFVGVEESAWTARF